MRYAISRYKAHQRDVAYRIYVTDCLRMMSENAAKYAGGSYLTRRFADVLHQKKDSRSGEEIVADVIKRAGLVVVE